MSRVRLVWLVAAAGLVAATVVALAHPDRRSSGDASETQSHPSAAQGLGLAPPRSARASVQAHESPGKPALRETGANPRTQAVPPTDDAPAATGTGREVDRPFDLALRDLEREITAMEEGVDLATAPRTARQAAFSRGLAAYDRARALAREPGQVARLQAVYDRLAVHMRALAEAMNSPRAP